MELMIKPSSETFDKASKIIKLMDSSPGSIGSNTSPIVSKIAKQVKRVKEPVPRFFESPNQIVSYWAEGEYDLVSIFKLLKFEAFFSKATQKKVSQLIKSGFHVNSDDDEILEYFQNRFLTMFLSTGVSLDRLIKQLAFYLITCSNSFIIKVRDPDFEYASSYTIDGKEMHPIVGLFQPHPTTIKPRFKYVTFNSNGVRKNKLVLDKWVHVNRRGMMVVFEPCDVAHFTLFKEDGMIFGTPEVISVIDDIKTLRKMEEDIQLLIYRDLFPIIHYQIEDPVVLDHTSGWTEMDQAKKDMERIIQDGGIATDKRHEINFVGNQGKSLDAKPYLEYFQQRVFTGLGVSESDLGMSSGGGGGGQNANSMSPQLLDAVRFIQQEITSQFDELILSEMGLQSPFGIEALRHESKATLQFTELDIEWKIRKENHEADLFTKGVKTIDEVRNPMGQKDFTDEHHARTYHGLYELPQIEADQEIAEKGLKVQASTKASQLKTKASAKAKKGPSARKATSTGKKSAATKDLTKSSRSNSNSVKSHRDEEQIVLLDKVRSVEVQEGFLRVVDSIKDTDKHARKLKIMIAAKCFYDQIKSEMIEHLKDGAADAMADMELDSIPAMKRFPEELFKPLDKLRDSIVELVTSSPGSANRAALRIATADRTEKVRAYNYGYSTTCVNNNRTSFIICADHDDISEDSSEYIGKEIELNAVNILDNVPPFRPNSRLKIRLKDQGDKNGEARI